MLSAWLLVMHLAGVIVWLGGMFFVLACLRPSLGELQPQQRAPLMLGVLDRFFAWVSLAILFIWASGLTRLAQVGMAAAPLGWHLMLALGAVMTVVFLVIRLRLHGRLRAQVARADLPAAGGTLERIRRLVLLNLVLGALTVVAAKVPLSL